MVLSYDGCADAGKASSKDSVYPDLYCASGRVRPFSARKDRKGFQASDRAGNVKSLENRVRAISSGAKLA
jgi:hypothetical protein